MKRFIAILFMMLIVISGCIPFTYYISPEVLPLKEKSTTVYLSRYFPQNEEKEINILNIEQRMGLGSNVDIGMGIMINDVYTGAIFSDVKYQFHKLPVPSALSLGLSYTGAVTGFGIYGIYGIHPSLVIGYKKFDISVTRNFIRPFGKIDIEPIAYSIINLSYEMGKFSPEITMVIPPSKNDSKMLLLGFGIHLGDIEE